jgi:hypothetical protein
VATLIVVPLVLGIALRKVRRRLSPGASSRP